MELMPLAMNQQGDMLNVFAELVAQKVANHSNSKTAVPIDFYWERHLSKVRSAAAMKANFERYFADLKDLPVDKIRVKEVQQWHSSLGEAKGEPTANRSLTLLRSVFNYGYKFELIDSRNPGKAIKKFKEHSRDRVAATDEVSRIVVAIDSLHSANRDLFKIMFFTAARRSNVCAMAWDELDLENGIWTIPASKFKTGSPTKIALIDQVVEILRTRETIRDPNCPWVFPSYSKQGHIMWPEASWRKILEVAGVKSLTMHDARRTSATIQSAMGANVPTIAGVLGHSGLQSAAVYARPQLETMRKSLQGACDVMLSKLSKPDFNRMAELERRMDDLERSFAGVHAFCQRIENLVATSEKRNDEPAAYRRGTIFKNLDLPLATPRKRTQGGICIDLSSVDEVEALKPAKEGQRYRVQDASLVGLCLLVRHGSMSWQVRKWCQGEKIDITLGKYPTLQPDVARSIAIDMISSLPVQLRPHERKFKKEEPAS